MHLDLCTWTIGFLMAAISSRALLVSRVCSTSLRRPFLRQSFNCSSSTNAEEVKAQHTQKPCKTRIFPLLFFHQEGLPSRHSVTKLPHRSLISIKGRDGVKLLQDLTTVDVGGLEESLALYSMFLNAQVGCRTSILLRYGRFNS